MLTAGTIPGPATSARPTIASPVVDTSGEAALITVVLIGLLGGLIAGVSPCVLPVLPVIFLTGGVAAASPVRAGTRQGRRAQQEVGGQNRSRPYLIVTGLALSFSVFTLLGTLILSTLPVPKDSIRWAGLVVLVLLGIAMLFPWVQHQLERPFSRIRQREVTGQRSGFVLGLALGAVYVPCAGTVLAAITVAGATGKIGWHTVALTVSFGIGTAIPLLIFALAGQRVAERVRAFRDRQHIFRIVAGLVVIGLAVALTFNVTDELQRLFPDYTAAANKALDAAGANKALAPQAPEALSQCQNEPATVLVNCGKAPAISGVTSWFNTPDNTTAVTTGKVTLVDFWAYSCINCQRAIPHVEAWYSAYAALGLQVVGVHTPEYAFEQVASNVQAGAKRIGITYPVALDNKYITWNNFSNDSWPAEYLIDSTGQIRHVAIGEGDYATTESLIRQLLTAANPNIVLPAATDVPDTTPSNANQTPETYLDSERGQLYSGSNPLAVGTQQYAYPLTVPSNQFALTGIWTVSTESITAGPNAAIKLSYNAANIYLDVGGTGTLTATVDGKTTTYQVSGAPNIYQLLQRTTSESGTLSVSLSSGLVAYSFTYG